MKIAFGCDHAAFKIKMNVMEHLKKQGHEVKDLGCSSAESCDYPDFAIAVAKEVSSGRAAGGVLICGSGIGMSIAANKISGVRAAVCWNAETAKLASEHNFANVLCLGARFLNEQELCNCIDTWLKTPNSAEPRHVKRIEKIMALEKDWKK